MENLYTFQILDGSHITDEQLKACATLFSNNYGVWAPDAPAPLKPGKHHLLSGVGCLF